jgi:hypothetical protein
VPPSGFLLYGAISQNSLLILEIDPKKKSVNTFFFQGSARQKTIDFCFSVSIRSPHYSPYIMIRMRVGAKHSMRILGPDDMSLSASRIDSGEILSPLSPKTDCIFRRSTQCLLGSMVEFRGNSSPVCRLALIIS